MFFLFPNHPFALYLMTNGYYSHSKTLSVSKNIIYFALFVTFIVDSNKNS